MDSNQTDHISSLRGLWLITKVQLLTSFGINQLKYERNRKKRGRYIGYLLGMTILMCTLIGYSGAIGFGLGYTGMVDVIPSFAIAITGIVTLMFTMLKSSVMLFGFRDYDMLMSLPIQNKMVITSKFICMYVINLLFTFGIMVPMGITYTIFSPEFNGLTILLWVLGMLIAPLIPMTIATILGAIIAAVSSRFKHKNLLSIIMSYVAICGIMIYSFYINSSGQSDAAFLAGVSEFGNQISAKMNMLYPPARLFESSICDNQIVPMLLLITISTVWFLLFINIIAIRYNSINTRIKSQNTKLKYKMQELKTSSPLIALYKKEAVRFFSSVGYVTNCGIGIIMALILSIISVVKGPEGMLSMFADVEVAGLSGIMSGVTCAIPFFLSAVISMTCTSAVSLSLEGKSLWIIKSLPIRTEKLLQSKILFNLSLGIPASFICGTLLLISFRPDSFFEGIWFILTPIVFSFFSSIFGMLINTKLPIYDWENEITVIKQSGASMFGIFGGMLIGIIASFIVMIIGFAGFAEMAAGGMTILMAAITVLIYKIVMRQNI